MIIQLTGALAKRGMEYIGLGRIAARISAFAPIVPSFIDLGAAAGAFTPNLNLGTAAGRYEPNLSLGAAAGKRTPNIDLGGSWLADD